MSTQKKTFTLTPEGTADYPYLITPDTKYKAEGEYKVKLKIPKSKESDELFTLLSFYATNAFDNAAQNARDKGKRVPKRAELPIYDDGTQYVLTAKLKASGVNKTTNQPFHQAPRLFDAQNKPWDKNVQITNGSKLRLCVEIVPYDSPTTGAGITLRLKDVQIVELGTGFNSDSPFGAAPARREEPPAFGNLDQLQGEDDVDF